MRRVAVQAPVLSVADALWRLSQLDLRSEDAAHAPSPKLRRDLATQVGARLLRRYDVLRQRIRPAVVQFHNDACTGCHTEFGPDHRYFTLDGSGEVEPCDECGRLIVFPEDSPFASAADPQ